MTSEPDVAAAEKQWWWHHDESEPLIETEPGPGMAMEQLAPVADDDENVGYDYSDA